MENEVVKVEENFAQEITKAFALSAAATAGMLTGAIVVGYFASKIRNPRETRETETAQEEN